MTAAAAACGAAAVLLPVWPQRPTRAPRDRTPNTPPARLLARPRRRRARIRFLPARLPAPAMSSTRTPAVSGQFYPSLPARLRADVRGFLGGHPAARRALAVIAPHALYRYAGVTAGAVFGRVEVPATCVVLGPNHRGRALSA